MSHTAERGRMMAHQRSLGAGNGVELTLELPGITSTVRHDDGKLDSLYFLFDTTEDLQQYVARLEALLQDVREWR